MASESAKKADKTYRAWMLENGFVQVHPWVQVNDRDMVLAVAKASLNAHKPERKKRKK